MAKKKQGVSEEVETQPVIEPEVEETDFTEDELAQANAALGITGEEQPEPETDEDDYSEVIDLNPEPETEEEEEKPAPVKKIDLLSTEELKRSYQNLEKVVGRQGQELGELRKKVAEPQTEPQTPEEKIKAMADSELDNAINVFKADILKPNASFEDEDYGQKVILYNDLKEERTLRRIEREQASKHAQTTNKQIINDFTATWSTAIGQELVDKAVKYATTTLSDQYGNITNEDLEVALHKIDPVRYKTAIKLAATEDDRKRINRAEAIKQPRLSGAGNSGASTGTISIDRLKKMDSDELNTLMEKLPYETVLKIERMLQKS